MLASTTDEDDLLIRKILAEREDSERMSRMVARVSNILIYGATCVLITRIQNTDYPHHKSMRLTLAEMIKHDSPRMFYLGLAPLLMSVGILTVASAAAVFVKRTYIAELQKKEKREFFQSIDWTQPEKITESDLEIKSVEQQLLHYGRRLICPSIMLLGALCSHPFNVISCHVMNYRYNEPNLMLNQNKRVKPMNSFRAFFYIRRKYGLRGFYRGFLPSVIFTTIVLWDSLIGGILKDTQYED